MTKRILSAPPIVYTVALAFGVAFGLLLLIDVLSYRSISELRTAMELEVQTHRVLDELDDLLIALNDAETGQRGYLLTGEERYLEPYDRSRRRIHDDLCQLRRHLNRTPRQEERLAAIEQQMAGKLAELDETIELRQTAGFAAAIEVVRTDRGKRLMDRIRALIRDMQAEEQRALAERNGRTREHARRTIQAIVLGSLLGLTILALALWRVAIDSRKRRGAEQTLRAAHDALEMRVAERTVDLRQANVELEAEMTRRQQAQDELAATVAGVEKSRDDLLSILDRLQLGTIMVDGSGRIAFVSSAAERLIGGSEGWLGKPLEECLPIEPAERERLISVCAESREARRRVAVHLRGAGGRRYWTEIDVQDDPREEGARILFLYDITEVYGISFGLDETARFGDLVGRSRAMLSVYRRIEEVARFDSTVLIEGETGTGKELVARAIHAWSNRSQEPFVGVNAAGLAESLLASELFGHRRGAFTGAVADHQGFFEAAGRGTLFLDEIGDVPPSVQASLLRVLQEKEIVRVGDTRSRPVDVRVLAATHHDLEAEIRSGRFRADLLFRIRVARIRVPPLRERREDIPLLVEAFLAEIQAGYGPNVENLGHEAMRRLLDYDWPGNVRELRSAIEFSVIRARGTVLQVEDLPPELATTFQPPNLSAPRREGADERQRILAALSVTAGNRRQAARLLGISRSTLYRWLDRHRISP
ncbi:MAG: sigma 54-interacting transcriptional regulator [Gemmatimonadota bacterium]